MSQCKSTAISFSRKTQTNSCRRIYLNLHTYGTSKLRHQASVKTSVSLGVGLSKPTEVKMAQSYWQPGIDRKQLRMKVTTRRDEMILGQAQKSAINGLGCLGDTLDWIRMLRRYCSADFTRKEKSVWQPGIDRHFL